MATAADYIDLGNKCFSVGEYTRAGEYYSQAVSLDPQNALAWCNLGVIQFQEHHIAEAEKSFLEALKLNPQYSLAYYNMALLCQQSGRIIDAIEGYSRTLFYDPTLIPVYNDLALLLKAVNRLEDSRFIFEKAIAIDPTVPLLHNNLGNVLLAQGRFLESRTQYQIAIALDPDYADAWANLGVIYRQLRQPDGARQALEKAIQLKGDIADYHHNMGVVAQEDGKITEAINHLNTAIKLNPDYEGSYFGLYLAKRQICDWEDLDTLEKKLDSLQKEDPFTTVMRSESLEKNYLLAQKKSSELEQKERKKVFDFDSRKPTGKIKIGYISHDLREHPIGQMIAPVFALHDRHRFEVYAYSYGGEDASEWYQRARKDADVWRDISETANPDVAEIIFRDGIDILVDITGYTMNNRMEVMAMKPAPVTVNYLGYPGTTGASFMDYIIADQTLIHQDEEKWYSEKVVYLPHCYQINNQNMPASTKKWTRKKAGLPEKGVVFACFNQVYKLDPLLFDVWARILKKIPGSVLWFWKQDDEAVVNLKKEAQKRGIDPTRIIFAPRLPKEEHLARLQLADLSLDTLIYGGHTTTTDSLYAGVPVVSLMGTHFASRVGASILIESGLAELVVPNLKKYEKLVIDLAQDEPKRKLYKQIISHENLKKNLFNTTRSVENLEKAYLQMWKRSVQKKAPERIIL